jgi:hypothetical protein
MPQDHVGLRRNQLFRQCRIPICSAGGIVNVSAEIAAIRPSQAFEPLQKPGEAFLDVGIVLSGGHKHTDATNTVLLRPHPSRPRHRRAAKQRDELTSPHIRS